MALFSEFRLQRLRWFCFIAFGVIIDDAVMYFFDQGSVASQREALTTWT